MELNGLAEGVQEQQLEKKLNVLTPTKENNSEIMINDLDTQFCITGKLSNGPKDSNPDSDSILPFSNDEIMHSVNKNYEDSNIDCGKSNINDSNVPTAVTENDEIENATKLSAFVRRVLYMNNIPKPSKKNEWPLYLLMESKHSVTITQQQLQNLVLKKAAEVMATTSYFSKEMFNIAKCEEQQRSYYKNYKELLKYVNKISSELELLIRVPDNAVKHVRNVGTSFNMPKKTQKYCSLHRRY